MLVRDAIGIDPDSEQFVCMFIRAEGGNPERKAFPITTDSLDRFVQWVKSKGDVTISIEGSNGQSKPIEKVLRKNNVVFYSFKPIDVERKRQSQLLPGKNNEKDAHAAALLAMEYERNGSLDRWKRVFAVDEELQIITRSHEKVNKKINMDISDLWKVLHDSSPDIYLFFGGKNKETDNKSKILDNIGVLNLLNNCPELDKWKELKREEMIKLMGGGQYKGREKIISMLQQISQKIQPLPGSLVLIIRHLSDNLLRLKKQKKEIEKVIESLAGERNTIKALMYNKDNHTGLKGIGALIASTIVAEIVHIGRFVKEDSLALYAGLGMIEDETGKRDKPGKRKKLKHFLGYNRRLKNAMINAAKQVVFWNKDHRLTGMFINFIKRGMSNLEAYKRVARALIRIIFRTLKQQYILECEKNSLSINNMEENGVAKWNKPRGESPQTTPPFSPVLTQEYYNKIPGIVNI